MREDEMEALLALDGAGLEVYGGRTGPGYAGYRANIRFPADFNNPKIPSDHHYMFTADGATRQEAIAKVWQQYQKFMTTKHGVDALQSAGQLMFRI